MMTNLNTNQINNKNINIANFFNRDKKIRYKTIFRGKKRLYVSDKNIIKDLSQVLSLYSGELH